MSSSASGWTAGSPSSPGAPAASACAPARRSPPSVRRSRSSGSRTERLAEARARRRGGGIRGAGARRRTCTPRRDADRSVAETVERFGRLDILVNAVGGGAGGALYPARRIPESEWDRIVDLNLRTTLLPSQAAVRAMIKAGNGGRILNSGLRPRAARAQRRLLGVRRREGRDQRAHPPARDRVGQVRDHRQRGLPDVRADRADGEHARRQGVLRAPRRPHPAAAGSPIPRISWARCSSSAPTRPRSSRARCSRSTAV